MLVASYSKNGAKSKLWRGRARPPHLIFQVAGMPHDSMLCASDVPRPSTGMRVRGGYAQVGQGQSAWWCPPITPALPTNLAHDRCRTASHPQPFLLKGEPGGAPPDPIAPCGESGRGLPQSKTLSRVSGPPTCPPCFGLRQSSGAWVTDSRWTTGDALFRFRSSKREIPLGRNLSPRCADREFSCGAQMVKLPRLAIQQESKTH
jgi:hypothetical protein